jgi:DEAD/DEAH box helicase domain-containing protein
MLPSLLARDIQQGIKQFLITGFEPADGFFHGVMRCFVDNEPAWMKGPYLQVSLPFRHDSTGRDFLAASRPNALPIRTSARHGSASRAT